MHVNFKEWRKMGDCTSCTGVQLLETKLVACCLFMSACFTLVSWQNNVHFVVGHELVLWGFWSDHFRSFQFLLVFGRGLTHSDVCVSSSSP